MAWNRLHTIMSDAPTGFGEGRFCAPCYRLSGPNCGEQNLRKQFAEPAPVDPA